MEIVTEGSEVEVRTRFDGRWVRGYSVAAIDAAGIRVARTRDEQVLPGLFGTEEVRPVSAGDGRSGPARVA